MPTITLYRPVGQKELDLIAASGYTAFPPRLPDQPIFYPVITLEYAEQIARDWNTRDERSGYAGYVVEFDVDAGYLEQFEIKKVGGSTHLEYWIRRVSPPAALVINKIVESMRVGVAQAHARQQRSRSLTPLAFALRGSGWRLLGAGGMQNEKCVCGTQRKPKKSQALRMTGFDCIRV